MCDITLKKEEENLCQGRAEGVEKVIILAICGMEKKVGS